MPAQATPESSFDDYSRLLLGALQRKDLAAVSRIADVLSERNGCVGPWTARDRKLNLHRNWILALLESGRVSSPECLGALWHQSYHTLLHVRTAFAVASLRFPLGLRAVQLEPFCFTRNSVRVPSLLRAAIGLAKFEHLAELQLEPWCATRADFCASFPVPYPDGTADAIQADVDAAGELIVADLAAKFNWRPGASELAAFCMRAIAKGHCCLMRRLLSIYEARSAGWPGLTLVLAANAERFEQRLESVLLKDAAGVAGSFKCATQLCLSLAAPVRFQACSIVVQTALMAGSVFGLLETASVLLEPANHDRAAGFEWAAWFDGLLAGKGAGVVLGIDGTATAMDLALALANEPFAIGAGTALIWVGLVGCARTLDNPSKVRRLALFPWALDIGDLWRALIVGCTQKRFSPAGAHTLLAAFCEDLYDYIVDLESTASFALLVRALFFALVRCQAVTAIKVLGVSPRWREAVRPFVCEAINLVLADCMPRQEEPTAAEHAEQDTAAQDDKSASLLLAIPMLEVLSGAPWSIV